MENIRVFIRRIANDNYKLSIKYDNDDILYHYKYNNIKFTLIENSVI